MLAALLFTAGCNEFEDGRVCPMMTAKKAKTNISVEYEGETYFVCCKKCKRSFEASPVDYMRLFEAAATKPAPQDK